MKMSANMFTQTPPATSTPKTNTTDSKTKIPVPASPTPVRRQGSLQLKSESDTTRRFSYGSSRDANHSGRFTAPTSRDTNHSGRSTTNAVLKRGHSLMERGEHCRGSNGGGGFAVARRAENVKIEPRNPGALKGATTPQSPSRIRSLSLSLSNTRLQSNAKSPSVVNTSPNNPISQEARNFSTSHLDYWDSGSVTSIGSSVASCDHASVARNGTTFSGRSMKYVFHCNQHAGATGEDYLTPTQRAHRQVKKLKYLLQQAKKDLEQKDSDILKLTKEVVELRLYKAALNSPEDKSNSSDAVTVRENTSEDTTPVADVADSASRNNINELNSSCADSGHFEDCTNSSVHSKDSVLFDDHRSPYKSKAVETADKGTTANLSIDHDSEHTKIIMEYERRLQELVRTHEDESYQLKQKHNDKIEELLQRITEINTRYWQLVPELETAKERIKELEQQLEEASKKLEEQEEKAKETYAKMYTQGQEAAKVERENMVMELAHQNPSRVSVPELLQELQVTKNELENIKAMYRQLMEAKSKNKIDPEITLQFLKSAIYYFLTDKENSQGHLKAIQSILGFSSNEITNIDKARLT
ncbi:myosin-9 isoform X2 [Anoplophora glabripennis]|uniref:myosin-9 isoform X2 n=1 Tax=Anoplophora glabripennis TaxID=217634 RepID=UPI000873E9C1|nr:myosin-9 isoform X2 [Anoplophora glabripennis]